MAKTRFKTKKDKRRPKKKRDPIKTPFQTKESASQSR
jgi:hypothetical protein